MLPLFAREGVQGIGNVWSIIDGPHHSSIYLALNAGQAARARLRVACPPAAAAALLTRRAQGAQLVLLVHVNAANPRRPKEGAAPPGGQRLQEEVVVHLSVVHVQVVLRDVVQRQRVGLHGRHSAVLGQLVGGHQLLAIYNETVILDTVFYFIFALSLLLQ